MLLDEILNTFKQLHAQAENIHHANRMAGWWNNYDNPEDRHNECFLLIMSEVFEAFEAYRKDLNDKHLPEYKGIHVEIVDAIIRTLDFIGALKPNDVDNVLPIETAAVIAGSNFARENSKIGVFMKMTQIIYLGFATEETYQNPSKEELVWAYDMLLVILIMFMVQEGQLNNIQEILDKKMTYNAQRADHKLENRMKEGGKRF